ncbi:hypothetical protein DFJ77DRAFT_431696 [Powellomyces hirtus]|nr:hypothetical protein DFJ77DRAFT_436098 [Powellomyces hirtus]KAI8913006.1 hypothetical protein DFJ77DRAFT_431696 [Powellomyces hirtus]
MPHSICITSADGQTGHLVSELLLTDKTFSSKYSALACVSFDSSKTSDLEKLGATVVPVDLAATKTARSKALVDNLKSSKIDTIMLIPPARKEKMKLTMEMVEAAKKAGVRNVLLLSTAGCDLAERDTQPNLRSAIDIEKMVMETKGNPDVSTGHSPCIIRAGFYAENLLLYSKQTQSESVLPLPIGSNHKFAPVALGDIALLAAHILTGEGKHGFADAHRGQLITVTGPMMVAGEELVQAVQDAIGVKLQFKDIDEKTAKNLLTKETDVDPSEIDVLLEYYSLVREGKTNYVSTVAFQAVTGQAPQELTEFFKVYDASFSRKKRRTTKEE